MYVYRVGYKKQIDSIFNNGYSRQFLASNEGTDYGDGVYCNIDIRDSLKRLHNTPDGCIIKNEIKNGLYGYLIFNEKYAKETYGNNYLIKDQVYLLFPKDVADKVWNDFTTIMRRFPSAKQHMHGRTAELLQVLLSPRRGQHYRREYERLFKEHNIRGAIYYGLKDGLCIVAYDFGECIPVAYSLDGGKTFKTKEYKGGEVDVHKKYGLKYKKVDYPILIQCDGETYEFSRVLKNNGKYNYIDAKSGEEFSSIDFDSATLINPHNGMFEIEYNGRFYEACPDGFFDDNGDGHTFDELANLHESINIQELKFEEILNSAIQELHERFIGNKPLINESLLENDMDEVKYLDYEIPTLDELDNDETISLYHVTPRASVESIFNHEFDREFNKKNGNVYGAGVYTSIYLHDAQRLVGSYYGDAIIQSKLIGGFDRFLIFNEPLAKKYYGENYKVLDQLKTMFPPNIAYKLYNDCYNTVESYAKIAGRYNIRGAVFRWNSGIAVLPFDFSSLIPYAISLDGGKTFQKKVNDQTLDRAITSIDVNYRYGHLYKRIDKAIDGYNENGERTGFSRVLKKNGKYNYIDIQTGQDISPIDFDSVTSMDRNNGEFEIEYKGKFYHACVDGFFDNDGDGHTFDELAYL